MRKTANEHLVSQPAVTLRFQALEHQLGVRLFTKSSSGTIFTESGEVILEWCLKILHEVESFQESLKTLAKDDKKDISVIASLTIAEYLLPHWIALYNSKHYSRKLSLSMGNTQTVIDGVKTKKYLLGFIEGSTPPRSLKNKLVGEDELIVISNNPLKSLPLSKFLKLPLILREKGSGTREVIETYFSQIGVELNCKFELPSNNAIKAAVRSGQGLSIMSRLAVESELKEQSVSQIHIDKVLIKRNLYAIFNSENVILVKQFLDTILDNSTKR